MVVSGTKCAITSITDESIYVNKNKFVEDKFDEDEIKVIVKIVEGLLDMIVLNRSEEDQIRLLSEVKECSNYLIGDRINEARLALKKVDDLNGGANVDRDE